VGGGTLVLGGRTPDPCLTHARPGMRKRETPAMRKKRLQALRESLAERYPDASARITSDSNVDSVITTADKRNRSRGGSGALPNTAGRPVSLPEIASATPQPAEDDSTSMRAASAMDDEPSSRNSAVHGGGTGGRRSPVRIARSTARRFEKAERSLRAQVRDQWRAVNRSFQQLDKLSGGNGMVSEQQLQEVLFRSNIIIEDKHFQQLLYKIDENGDGAVSYKEFLKYFGKGSPEDRNINSRVGNVSVDQAIQMVRTKIEGRLRGGPAALRRAFQFFDSDGSGVISPAEFKSELRRRCGLEFEEELLREVMARFDEDQSGIDYRKFSQLVMGSSATDATSFGDSPAKKLLTEDDSNGTSAQFIRRKIREQWKSLGVAFRAHDRAKTGYIRLDELHTVLRNHQVDFSAAGRLELEQCLERDPVRPAAATDPRAAGLAAPPPPPPPPPPPI
jgi:Ca2+-binding EF-hand superfamily protein